MGLSISAAGVDAFTAPYGQFSEWRNYLARAAGYEVAQVKGENELWGRPIPLIDYGHMEYKNYFGEWDTLPEDPLLLLFVHSDCEGILEPEHCRMIADRLEDLLPRLIDEPLPGNRAHYPSFYQRTVTFLRAMRAAEMAGERAVFA